MRVLKGRPLLLVAGASGAGLERAAALEHDSRSEGGRGVVAENATRQRAPYISKARHFL